MRKRPVFSAHARQLGEERLLGYKKTAFSVRAKPTDKEKLFLGAPWQHFSTAPKLTCNRPFQIPLATVSLQQNIIFRNFAILRQHKGNPFAPIQILTGDTRKGCALRHRRLLDERRSCQRKSRIERRFESSPGVQRVATLWGAFGSFRTSEKNKLVPFAENIEVLQPSIQLAAMAASH